MKLSHLTLGALLLAASALTAQENPKAKRPKTETKTQRKRPETEKKVVKKDTLKGILPSHKIISPDYCPPCGMG